jgi:hypothetical protein
MKKDICNKNGDKPKKNNPFFSSFYLTLKMAMLNTATRRCLSLGFRLSYRFNSTKSTTVYPGENSDLRGDGAIRRTNPFGSTIEQTYAGVLSFLRRNYTRNLDNVDVAVTGIPLDLTTTYRCGTRFGPKAIREASVQLAELKSYPGGIDLFEDLSVIDYGDCWFDHGQPKTVPTAIEDHAKKIIEQNVFLLSLGYSYFLIK